MVNKLTVMGVIGIKRCYLNVTFDEAVKRFTESEGMTIEEFYDYKTPVDIFEFDDEFDAYDAYKK